MSTIKLHGNSSSNSYNFANDVDVPYEASSPDSPCSVYIDDFGLGPYELQVSRTKMSGGESPSSVLQKKKKKNDGKGQSQANKCLNEKRRREQENIYIEELAELISASFADMNSLSVKPDKCAILQETVKQVRAGTHRISSEQTDSLICTEGAVQQGEVSSSKPTRISNTELAPLLLSALDGFLFVVNSDSQIEFVTENIHQFLHYNKEEVLGKSVYNIIHHGDHTRFGVLLNNPLLIYGSSIVPPNSSNRLKTPLMEQLPSGSKGNSWNQKFSSKFNCRLLIKPPSDQNINEKQTIFSQYETLQISTTKINGMVDNTTDDRQNLLCIARRVPFNEKHLSAPLEQFTIKLDPNGEILALDTKDVSEVYSQHINKECLEGRFLHEKCHKNDVHKVINHLQETKQIGFSTSSIYKLHLIDDKYINVQTKSKYFKSNDTGDTDFIMAALSIIGDSEICAMIESNTISSRAAVEQNIESMSLMTSIASNHPVSNLPPETKFSNNDYNTPSTDLNFSDFGLFSNTTFGDMIPENKWSENSTSSVEMSSKTSTVPLGSSNPTSQIPYNSYSLNPLIQSPKESFDSRDNVERIESARLRTLLMTSKHLECSSENNTSKGKHNILKGLLNPDEISFQNTNDESLTPQNTPQSPNVQQASHSNFDLNDVPSTLNNTVSNNNILLNKLLNDKTQDEDLNSQIGVKKENELLQRLLNKDDNITNCDYYEQSDNSNEDLILKSMGFRILSPTSPDSRNHGSRKRNSLVAGDESEYPPLKRTNSSGLGNSVLESLPSVGCSTTHINSKLRERNKMLASLLAKDTPPTSIPSIPASVISATPQDKLVTIIKQSGAGWNSVNVLQNVQNQRTDLIQKNQSQVIPSNSQVPTQEIRQVTTSNEQNINSLPFNSDPELSDLLEEIMDLWNVNSDNSTLLNLFNVIESTNLPNSVGISTNQNSINTMNENLAVRAIQNSLMQVESTVKLPSQMNYDVTTSNTNNVHITNTQNQFVRQAYPHQKTAVKFNIQQSGNLAGVPPYTRNLQRQPLLHHQQKQKLIQQQEKQRLLKQQQNQEIMVVTTNTSVLPSPDPLKNIDSLLNNSGPPNVALQRSSNVQDSRNELNTVYASSSNQLQHTHSNIPQTFPMLNYVTSTQAQGSTINTSPTNSLHQSSINSCQQQTQNIYISQTQHPIVWTQPKLTVHQQKNPMLNAQLQVSGFNNNSVRQNFISQQQQSHLGVKRVIPSPLGYNSEVSPNTNCQIQQQSKFQQPRNINISGNPGSVTEYTKNELRAFVGVRSQHSGNAQMSNSLLPGQNVTPTELNPLGLNIEMSTDNKNPKWSGLNSNLNLTSPQTQELTTRNPNEDSSSTNSTNNAGIIDQKSSLLQKLLSENL